MKPIGPLMIEHRLIERMIQLIEERTQKIKEHGAVEPDFIDLTVDFIRTYADRTHHGKEEDILFRDLGKKNLSDTDSGLMDELVEEHRYGRELVAALIEAKERYLTGHKESLDVILDKMKALVDFYPEHIEKEDKRFFPAAMEYLNQEEQDAMLQECWEFDRQMIHEKYRLLIEDWEKGAGRENQPGKER